MNKKGSALIYIIVGGSLLLLLTAIVLIFLFTNNSKPQETSKIPVVNITLYLKALDQGGNDLETSYAILNSNNSIIQEGDLVKDWNEFNNVSSEPKLIYCWKKGYYTDINYKIFSEEEKSNKNIKTECSLEKRGNINVVSEGSISLGDNQIILNVSSDGIYKGLSACIEWSPGIGGVVVNEKNIFCDNYWKNYSFINTETKENIFLPTGYYSCGSQIERCKNVKGNNCLPYDMEIPKDYENKVDTCNYFGGRISNSTYQISLIVKAMPSINKIDFVKIHFFDQDIRLDKNKSLSLTPNYEGDINETTYEIKYETE